MDKLSNSISLFEKARSLYTEKRFEHARKLIKDYRQSVQYDLITRHDRRADKEVTTSIIIVSFGAEEGLLECLNSLSRQHDKDFEIILVDNGGNETIFLQLENYPLLHLCPPINFLPSEGRNLGAYFARGDYLVFIDDDAIVHPDYVNNLKNAWFSFDFLALRGKILPKSNSANNSFTGHYDLGEYPMPAVLMTEGNMTIKKEVFSAVGGFDPLLFGGEGTELTYRCQKQFPDKDIYYWPKMIIFHDFASGRNLVAKKKRHALASDYFAYLSPEINKLAAGYGRWYQSRPGGTMVYDQRDLTSKARAYAQERLIALKNKFGVRRSTPPLTLKDVGYLKDYAKNELKSKSASQKSGLGDASYYRALAEKLQTQLDETRSSISFRLGNALAEAAVSPVKNGPKLPKVLAGLLKDHLQRQKKADSYSGNISKRIAGVNLRNRKKYLQPGIEEHIFTEFDNFKSFKTTKNSSLRIACILGKHLYSCLDFEAELIPLDPNNWQQQLESQQPDLLLAQSTWNFFTRGWKEDFVMDKGPGQTLREVLNYCNIKKVPTAFWDTGYSTHFPIFAQTAFCFDHVFATDPKCVELYQGSLGSKRVIHLPLAVQPALHNPVRHETFFARNRDFSIFFDGWADMLEWPHRYKFLNELLQDGLHIVESRYRFVANKLNDLPKFQEHIMGHLTYLQLLSALRAYRVSLMFADSLSSPLSQARKAMEAAACGVVVVYKGPCNEFIPEDVVSYVKSDNEAIALCRKYLKEDHFGSVHNLKNRRKLFSKHTYAHRLQAICHEVGFKHTWEEYPLVSIITPTKRPEFISRALANYKSQTYLRKEWIILLNSSQNTTVNIEKICQNNPDIRVLQLHEEKNIGACLNLGIEKASGDYWFKMDDDDFYGPNYILDMMLEMRAVDADIFGKPTGFIYLEEKDQLLLRHEAGDSQHIHGSQNVPHMCGATISGKMQSFPEIQFSEDLRACVDTDFLRLCKVAGLRIYLSNIHGFAAMRGKDKTSHTWRAGDDLLKKNSTHIGSKEAIKKILV